MRLLVACALAFTGLTVLVGTGATDGLDAAVLDRLLPLRSPALTSVLEAVTMIAAPVTSVVLAVALAGWLVARARPGGLVPLFLLAGMALELGLKHLIFQPGPPSELMHDAPVLFSFRDVSPFTYPSGHAMRIAFLAVVVATAAPRLRVPLIVVVTVVALARVYLAAGWIADVAGGLIAGVALAALAGLVAARITAPRRSPEAGLAAT